MWTIEPSNEQSKRHPDHIRCKIVNEQRQEIARTAGSYTEAEELRLARMLAAAPELLIACRVAFQALQARATPDLARVQAVLDTALKRATSSESAPS